MAWTDHWWGWGGGGGGGGGCSYRGSPLCRSESQPREPPCFVLLSQKSPRWRCFLPPQVNDVSWTPGSAAERIPREAGGLPGPPWMTTAATTPSHPSPQSKSSFSGWCSLSRESKVCGRDIISASRTPTLNRAPDGGAPTGTPAPWSLHVVSERRPPAGEVVRDRRRASPFRF